MKLKLASISLLLSASTLSANPFDRPNSDHWCYQSVNQISNAGVMSGYTGDLFNPGSTASRYEIATVIARLLEHATGKSLNVAIRRQLDKLADEFHKELVLQNSGNKGYKMPKPASLDSTNKQESVLNKIQFGGHARIRQEARSIDQAPNANIKDSASRTLGRILIDTGYKGERSEVFTQLHYLNTHGDRLGGTGTNANGAGTGDLSLNQAWVSLKLNEKQELKLGRQAVSIGNQSLIGRLGWSNNPRSFDGLRFTGKSNNFDYSIMNLKLSNASSAAIAGLAPAAIVPANANDSDLTGVDLYRNEVFDGKLHLHWYHSNGIAHGRTAVNATANNLNTYGFDWTRTLSDWSIYIQYAKQTGDNGVQGLTNIKYDGDMFNLKAMYKLNPENSVGIEYTRYSGDNTIGAGTANSYDGFIPLYPTGHKFLGFADVFSQNNIEDLTFHWIRNLSSRNDLSLSYHIFDLENTSSAASLFGAGAAGSWTGIWNAPVAAANTNGRFEDDLGTEIDLYFSHRLNSDTSIGVGYALFFAGDYFTANKAPVGSYQPDVNFAWISTDIKF